MDNYEEIYNVIKKWFEGSLKTSIKIPEDLSDGRYYLELLKRCVDLEIPNSKSKNYETIEGILNKFYGFETNIVVDYYEFLYSPEHENIISLCIFCFIFCQRYNDIPKEDMNQDDFKRLYYLTSPLNQCLQEKKHPTMKSFRNAIEKAKERELEDISVSSSSFAPLAQSYNGSSKDEARQPVSDDEFSNSSNIPSFISENSFNAKSTHDFIGDALNHDRIKFPLRKPYKNPLGSKPRKNQNLFLSPAYRRSVNSPKLNESRKMEQRRLKILDCENHTLKQEICQLTEDVQKFDELEKKLNNEVCKLKADNRKLMDNIDCLNATVEENSLIYSRKDKELEKFRKDTELSKKINGEKSDEIRQLEHSNHKLRQDIHELNNQLKTRSSQCEVSMKNEVDICQEKRVLQDENSQLKINLKEMEKQLLDLQNAKFHTVERDTLLESPVSNIEVGESLDIINQFKLAEIMNEFEEKQTAWEEEIKQLKSQLHVERENCNDLKTREQDIQTKFQEVSAQLENFHSKFVDKEDEIKRLAGINANLNRDIENKRDQFDTNVDADSVEDVVDIFRNLFSRTKLSYENKNELLKTLADIFDVDFSRLERNHDLCRNEISSLHQKLRTCKSEMTKKDDYIKNMNNVLYENEQQFHELKQDFASVQSENQEINRLWHSQKSKNDEAEFKLKKTLVAVEKERREAVTQNNILKDDLLIRETELQKSNQEFNILRSRYDQCLCSLHKMAKDCEDYEQVIREVTDNQKRPLRNVSCQTDFTNHIGNSSCKVVHNLERGNSYRPSLIREASYTNRVNDSLYTKRNNDVSLVGRLPYNGTDSFRKDPYDYQNENDQDKMSLLKNWNCDYKNPSYTDNYDNAKNLDPRWIKFDKFGPKVDTNVVEQRPIYSPSVKSDRLHQMISRNLQQPEHLKSSYPVETQTLAVGHLAHMLTKAFNIDDDLTSETSRPEHTARSSARQYTHVDPMNLRSNINGQGIYNFDNNTFSDNLIKATNSNGLTPRNMVLSARSNNQSTPRNECFQLQPAASMMTSFRDNDREKENVNLTSDKTPEPPVSMKFEIVNTPKRKTKRNNNATVKKCNKI